MIAGSTLIFLIDMKYVVYVPHNEKFGFQTDLGRENLASYYGQGSTVAFDFSHHGHALVTLYVQFLCSDWSKFDR